MNVFNKLSDLEINTQAVVDFIDPACSTCLRLQELGFVSGTSVKVVRKAPFGDPLEIQVRGTRISLRAQEAQAIVIRPA